MGTKWKPQKHMGRDGPDRRLRQGGWEGEDKGLT